jgi:hypothetical protein
MIENVLQWGALCGGWISNLGCKKFSSILAKKIL